MTRGGAAGRSLTSSGSHTVIWHRSYSPNPSKNSSNPNEPTCQFQKIGFRGAVWAAIQRRFHGRILMSQVLECRQASYLTILGRENPILRLYPVPFCPNPLWFSALLPTWLLFKRVNLSESRPSAGTSWTLSRSYCSPVFFRFGETKKNHLQKFSRPSGAI